MSRSRNTRVLIDELIRAYREEGVAIEYMNILPCGRIEVFRVADDSTPDPFDSAKDSRPRLT